MVSVGDVSRQSGRDGVFVFAEATRIIAAQPEVRPVGRMAEDPGKGVAAATGGRDQHSPAVPREIVRPAGLSQFPPVLPGRMGWDQREVQPRAEGVIQPSPEIQPASDDYRVDRPEQIQRQGGARRVPVLVSGGLQHSPQSSPSATGLVRRASEEREHTRGGEPARQEYLYWSQEQQGPVSSNRLPTDTDNPSQVLRPATEIDDWETARSEGGTGFDGTEGWAEGSMIHSILNPLATEGRVTRPQTGAATGSWQQYQGNLEREWRQDKNQADEVRELRAMVGDLQGAVRQWIIPNVPTLPFNAATSLNTEAADPGFFTARDDWGQQERSEVRKNPVPRRS
jgi:hypothetical protein